MAAAAVRWSLGAFSASLAVLLALDLALGLGLLHALGDAVSSEVKLGIDLGTTRSVAAVCSRGNVSVIMGGTDEPSLPSTVWFSKSRGIQVGREAVLARAHDPGNVVYAAKRVMGLEFGSAEALASTQGLPFEWGAVEERGAAQGSLGFRLQHGRVVSPEQVGALVLRKLKHAAERDPSTPVDWLRRALGFSFRSATVSIPVSFSAEQKKATVRAAKMAGFYAVRLIEEPIAAALAFNLDRRSDLELDRVLVFDIGGGTLDVALLNFNKYSGTFYVDTTAGEPLLGGEDFDVIVAESVLAQLPVPRAAAIREDRRALQELLVASEMAKRVLSDRLEVSICLPTVTAGAQEQLFGTGSGSGSGLGSSSGAGAGAGLSAGAGADPGTGADTGTGPDTVGRTYLHLQRVKREEDRKARAARDADRKMMGCAAHDRINVTRQQFRQAGNHKFQAAMRTVQAAMQEAGLTLDARLDVVLVGGTSRIPAIRQDIQELLPNARVHIDGVDPDHAVAIGAAKSWGCNR
jgi:molecular chaperone DnaK (HSP70)